MLWAWRAAAAAVACTGGGGSCTKHIALQWAAHQVARGAATARGVAHTLRQSRRPGSRRQAQRLGGGGVTGAAVGGSHFIALVSRTSRVRGGGLFSARTSSSKTLATPRVSPEIGLMLLQQGTVSWCSGYHVSLQDLRVWTGTIENTHSNVHTRKTAEGREFDTSKTSLRSLLHPLAYAQSQDEHNALISRQNGAHSAKPCFHVTPAAPSRPHGGEAPVRVA